MKKLQEGLRSVRVIIVDEFSMIGSHILLHNPEEPFAMIVTGDPVTGKSTVIKSMCARLNDVYSNTYSVQLTALRMGTTGTAYFVIGGVTCHSVLYIPINRPFTPLSGI